MAIEVVVEIFKGVFRFIFRILTEVLMEFMLKGAGYFICRPFSRKINPDSFKVLIIGLVFWVLLLIATLKVLNFVQVDKCLDSGGSYNYQTKACVHQN